MDQRALIFDSLQKVIGHRVGGKSTATTTKKGMGREAEAAALPPSSDSRGTFTMTWGAGYHGQLGRKFVRGEKKYAAIPQLVREPTLVVRQGRLCAVNSPSC